MVNGILTIPLPGHGASSPARSVAAGQPLSEFVAGQENSLAAHALRPYLDRQQTAYSPLVLYGPHGCGKSHLACGLAAWWSSRFPDAQVVCLPAAEFAQNYAAALASQRLEAWRAAMRRAALFVLEDLGQLTGKRGAQLELLYTLDALEERGALVVVTARRLPHRAATLLSALRGRLSAGLAVPLAPPGAAARRVILERLAASRQLALSKRAIHGLADGLETTVPGLLAAVLELEFGADGEPGIDAARVWQVVVERSAAKAPDLREIAHAAAKYFGLKLTDLKSASRQQPLVAARGIAMHLARELTKHSLEQIGTYFGGRDHSTVLHGCRRTARLLKQDPATRQAVEELKGALVAR